MTERTMQVADWMKTPEFQKRHDTAVEARDKADFECFRVLKEMADNEMLNKHALMGGLKREIGHGVTKDEAEECSEHFADEVTRVLKLRADADQEYGDCIRNIPKRED